MMCSEIDCAASVAHFALKPLWNMCVAICFTGLINGDDGEVELLVERVNEDFDCRANGECPNKLRWTAFLGENE